MTQKLKPGMLLDIFYPRRCPVCDDILRISEGLVHSACLGKVRYVDGPFCMRCGKPILNTEDDYCSDCRARHHYFDQGRSVWIYDDLMRKSIGRYKYHDARAYADFYVTQMAAMCGGWMTSVSPDVLVPVPVHWKKKYQRGYNQAELLAKKLGKICGIPVDTKYLVRTESTAPQKNLTPMQRYANLKHAFQVRSSNKTYRTVLLVDDIYTTGSTIDACASVLKHAGVQKVFFISLCTGSDC